VEHEVAGGGFSNNSVIDEVVHGFKNVPVISYTIKEIPNFKAFIEPYI
jgi:hypothetical protein